MIWKVYHRIFFFRTDEPFFLDNLICLLMHDNKLSFFSWQVSLLKSWSSSKSCQGKTARPLRRDFLIPIPNIFTGFSIFGSLFHRHPSYFVRFCEDCINQTWAANGNQNCPVCRKATDGTKDTDFDMIQQMSSQSINCSRCHKHVSGNTKMAS